MTSIQSELYIVGAETGISAYIREIAGGERGMIYCVAHDSSDSDHRRVADEVRRRRMPVVVVSSWEVYPEGIDEVIYDNSRVSPDTPYGEKCAAAEHIISTAAREAAVSCAILRPAMMFGTDVHGEGQQMFDEVASNRWFGVRQHPTYRSLVCALDIARVALLMIGRDGIYNVSDNRKATLTDLAAAMSANTGYWKRPIVFPLPVAKIIAKLADAIPFVYRGWNSRALRSKLTDRVLDTAALSAALPDHKFYNTLDVISRTDADYPYQTK